MGMYLSCSPYREYGYPAWACIYPVLLIGSMDAHGMYLSCSPCGEYGYSRYVSIVFIMGCELLKESDKNYGSYLCSLREILASMNILLSINILMDMTLYD